MKSWFDLPDRLVTLCILLPVLWSWIYMSLTVFHSVNFNPEYVDSLLFYYYYRRGRRRKDDKSPRLPKRRWGFVLLCFTLFLVVGILLTYALIIILQEWTETTLLVSMMLVFLFPLQDPSVSKNLNTFLPIGGMGLLIYFVLFFIYTLLNILQLLVTSNKLYGNCSNSINLLFPNSAVWVKGRWADLSSLLLTFLLHADLEKSLQSSMYVVRWKDVEPFLLILAIYRSVKLLCKTAFQVVSHC